MELDTLNGCSKMSGLIQNRKLRRTSILRKPLFI